MIVCTICNVSLPETQKGIALANAKCVCGATGNWQRSTTTAERFEAAVRDMAASSGLEPDMIYDVLSYVASEFLAKKKSG